MLHGMEFEEERIDPLVRLSASDVAVPSRLAAAHGRPPWPSPGQEILLQGGYDLLRDLLADFGLAGHRSSSDTPPIYSATDLAKPRLLPSYQERMGRSSPLPGGIVGRLPAFEVSFETGFSLKVSSLNAKRTPKILKGSRRHR